MAFETRLRPSFARRNSYRRSLNAPFFPAPALAHRLCAPSVPGPRRRRWPKSTRNSPKRGRRSSSLWSRRRLSTSTTRWSPPRLPCRLSSRSTRRFSTGSPRTREGLCRGPWGSRWSSSKRSSTSSTNEDCPRSMYLKMEQLKAVLEQLNE